MNKDITKHYRYIYKITNPENKLILFIRAEIILLEYDVLSETPKGYWIGDIGTNIKFKWVSKDSVRRFAYPTKREAIISLYKRTNRRIGFLTRDLELAQKAFKLIEKLKEEILDDK